MTLTPSNCTASATVNTLRLKPKYAELESCNNLAAATTWCHGIGERPRGLNNNHLNLPQHLRRCQGAQAFFGSFKMTFWLQAGRAGEIQAQNIFKLAIRTGAARLRRAEQRDERFAERGGGVHRAGVVRHHQITAANPLDHFRQRSSAAQIQAALRRGLKNNFAERLIVLAAKNGEANIRKFLRQRMDQFGKISGRPAFVFPAKAQPKCE